MKEILNNIVGGRYYVLEELGRGGFSSVYKVKDINSGEVYALKQYITSDPANHKRLLEGIEKELDVLKYTAHPVLPKIYNVIKEDNRFFLVMEYVEGVNLKKHVDSEGVMNNKDIVSVMYQICSGLYYLHSMEPPVVYRDLKPSNIILMQDGRVKLIDFGISKRYSREADADELACGSKGFAAPEQYGDKRGRGLYNTDIRTDIYGIGTTMYYLRTGKRFSGKINNYSILDKIKGRSISAKMKKVIIKCTYKNPDERYQNCIELLCAIKNLHIIKK